MAKKAAAKADPIGASMSLGVAMVNYIAGTVKAGESGIIVEAKAAARSSKYSRTLYPYGDVLAFVEASADAGGHAIVQEFGDVSEGSIVVADAESIQFDADSGWYTIPQVDGEGNELPAIMVNGGSEIDATIRVLGDSFSKESTEPKKAATKKAATKKAAVKTAETAPEPAATPGAKAAKGKGAKAAKGKGAKAAKGKGAKAAKGWDD